MSVQVPNHCRMTPDRREGRPDRDTSDNREPHRGGGTRFRKSRPSACISPTFPYKERGHRDERIPSSHGPRRRSLAWLSSPTTPTTLVDKRRAAIRVGDPYDLGMASARVSKRTTLAWSGFSPFSD